MKQNITPTKKSSQSAQSERNASRDDRGRFDNESVRSNSSSKSSLDKSSSGRSQK